jgi:hypothetical protein
MITAPGPPYVYGSIAWDGSYPPAPQPNPVAFCVDDWFVLVAPPTPSQNVFPVF